MKIRIAPKANYEDSILHYLLLVLASINALGEGNTIFLLFCVFAFFRKRTYIVKLSMDLVSTILLFVSVFLASSYFFGIMDVIRSFNYLFPWFIGYVGFFQSNDGVLYIKRTIFAFFMGFTLNVLITYIYNLTLGIVGGRVMYSIWTGETIAVTLVGLWCAMIIGFFFYGAFLCKKILVKIVSFAAMVLALVVSSSTATRTAFLIFAIVLVVMYLVYLFSHRGVKAFKTVGIMLATLTVVAVVLLLDIGGLYTYIKESPIMARFEMEQLESARGDIVLFHLENMWDYPFGGAFLQRYTHAHNYLQEAHDLYGFGAMLALLLYLGSMLKNMIVLVTFRNKRDVDYLLFSMYMTMLIQMCLEPVLSGYPVFFWSFLMIHGMTSAYLKSRRDPEALAIHKGVAL